MSWILGIDTSSVDLGIGLYHGNDAVASYSRFVRNSHAEHVSQVVSMILSVNNVKPHDVRHIAVSVGPGSFTGLRIGLAFVKGFCFGRHTSILQVSSLEILAYAAQTHNGRVLSVIDARNGDVFVGVFKCTQGIITRIAEDSATTVSAFQDIIERGDIIVTDTMGYAKSTAFTSMPSGVTILSAELFKMQRGIVCAGIGSKNQSDSSLWTSDTTVVLPNYLREFTITKPSTGN
jgi:tRNA threonylcarbamoyl adenosine modification protein YeaZ